MEEAEIPHEPQPAQLPKAPQHERGLEGALRGGARARAGHGAASLDEGDEG